MSSDIQESNSRGNRPPIDQILVCLSTLAVAVVAKTWQRGAKMAAARSVIVRFTSSSTSTAAPAAARLASLRQRVLQARSGVPKIGCQYRNSPRRTSSTADLARRRPNTPHKSPRAPRAPKDARRPTCPSDDHRPYTQTRCRRRQGRTPRQRWLHTIAPPPRRRGASLPTRAPDWENNLNCRRSPPPSPAPTRSRATSPRRTASRTPPCA